MKAKCLEVIYEEGDFYLTQGVKKGTKTTFSNGYVHSPRGNGYGNNYKPSHLILYFEIDGYRRSAWVDRYFKDSVGRLTEKRRNKIISTMPSTVTVEEFVSLNDGKYYVVSDEDMEMWLSRTGL